MNKNIAVISFTALFVTIVSVSAFAEEKDGWKPLFGVDLSDAMYDKNVWIPSDGVLTPLQDQAIWSAREYENFVLELEFKNEHETNSGVIVYCSDRDNWVPNAVEIQIADDYCEKWSTSPLNWQCGAIFGHLAAKKQKVVREPGEWNSMRITCKGKTITVVLNEEKVTRMDMSKWTSSEVNPDGTKVLEMHPIPFAELPVKGYVGLQGKHGDASIWFRNIRIKEL